MIDQAASSKADAVIADNPDQTLDDLVASKKLNADQKAQVLKKPALQAQLKQYIEQVVQCRKVEKDLEDRFAVEKAHLIEQHQAELARTREEVAAEANKTLSKTLDEGLLVLSRFLHAAAAKRQTAEAESEEGRAFEGALLLVYQGNNASLTTLKNLIAGSEDKVTSTLGEPLDFTFAQIKQSSIDDAPPLEETFEEEPDSAEAATVETENVEASAAITDPAVTDPAVTDPAVTDPAVTDPTVAHAGLTELDQTDSTPIAMNGVPEAEHMKVPEQASVAAEAANAVAENSWDPQASGLTNESGAGEGWVEVPRDPGETETGVAATPAAMHGGNSWAEEVTEVTETEEKVATENDGFEQVVHHGNRDRGRGRGRGGDFRGRGRSGEGFRGGRGRGDRGDRGDGGERRGGRGRGRGEGFRGGNRGRARDGGPVGSAPRPAETS